VVCQNAATLVYLANQACITPHLWLSRQDKPDHPDRMIFDLDPWDDDFEPVRSAARSLKKLLEALELVPFLMTTGSRGLHVVVPLDRKSNFDEVREFALDVADLLANQEPGRLTTEQSKEKRGSRIFVDVLRNAYAQTTPAPYAVRAKAGAPVAAPLEWEELSSRSVNSRRYTLRNMFRRLGQKEDPWEGMGRRARSLDPAKRRLDDLRPEKESK
jgi:bifunctional non-homologous end joining protein LigD